MSPDLFELLPAVYRIRDAQLAQSQTLLTAAEIADLNALQAQTTPLTSDQQAQLDQLTAKASRGPLQSLLMLSANRSPPSPMTSTSSTTISSSRPARHG